jgi:lipoprotein-releasing system permease protein
MPRAEIMEAGAKPLSPVPQPATPLQPVGTKPPPAPKLTRGWVFSGLALTVVIIGLYVSALLCIGAVGLLSGRAQVAPENAFKWALFIAAVAALNTGFLAGYVARRFAFFELLIGCLVFLAGGISGLGFLAFHPFQFGVLPADVVYLIGLMPNPIAGPSLCTVFLCIAAIVGLPIGFMARGKDGLSFASAYEMFIARRHLGITPVMLLLVGILILTLFVFLIPMYLVGKIVEGVERNRIATIAHADPVEAERLLYELERRRGSPTRTMTTISLCAVALGVAALCVVLSVMSGFEVDLKKKILGTNAHAVVLKYGQDFGEYGDVEKKVRSVNGVTGVSPFILNEVMISSEQNISGVLIKGIDPATVGQVSDLPANIVEGSLASLSDPSKIQTAPAAGPGDTREVLKDLDLVIREREEADKDKKAPAPKTENKEARKPELRFEPGDSEEEEADDLGLHPHARPPTSASIGKSAESLAPKEVLPAVVLGRELARSLKVYVGDRVNVVSPLGGDLGPQGPMPKSRPFRVGGIFYSGMYEYDSKFAYIDLKEAMKFFNPKDAPDNVSGLELKVKDIDDARKVARAVLTALDGYPYRTKDWGEMNRNLFSALRLEKLVMAIILAIIVVVACLLILGTLVVLAFEKRKEIAILKSLGASESNIMKVFILEGSTVGIVGTVIGLAAGFGLCLFVEVVGIHLDPEVYYINRLPVRIDAFQFGVVAAISLVLCFLGTIYPALAASELSPVEGLRND